MSKLNILYLEDSPYDASLAGRILKKAGIEFDFRLVDTEDQYMQALTTFTPDVVLADHSLFQFNSSEALRLFRKTGLKIPFILVTGTVSEEFAVDILHQGADDYLLKSNLTRLPTAIMKSLEKYRLENERQAFLNHIFESEALLKEAEQLALFGCWEADCTTGEIRWSDGVFRICGYEPGTIVPDHSIIVRQLHPDDRLSYQEALNSQVCEKDIYSQVIRLVDRKGIHRYISARIVAKRAEDGRLQKLVGILQDITEKTELEKELGMQAIYQQKLITEVAIQAQEKERNEIGRELHDNINQVLATIKMYLRLAAESEDRDKRISLIDKSADNIDYAIEEIRKLSKSLVAPSLGDLGLVVALQDLADDINDLVEFQILIVSELDTGKQLNKNLELMLYRIAQEQLNNIRKYAQARNVIISFRLEEERVHFSVKDDGQGFDVSKKATGIGLRNIRSRVEFYSGTMQIISAPGEGCHLEITIPLI